MQWRKSTGIWWITVIREIVVSFMILLLFLWENSIVQIESVDNLSFWDYIKNMRLWLQALFVAETGHG
jgi:hypothetical protein